MQICRFVSMKQETTTVRIRETVHKKVKIYAAKTEASVLDVLDCALLWYMNEFPANSKSIYPKSKTKHQ